MVEVEHLLDATCSPSVGVGLPPRGEQGLSIHDRSVLLPKNLEAGKVLTIASTWAHIGHLRHRADEGIVPV